VTTAVLGLGGNIGDTHALMRDAIRLLSAQTGVALEAVSALYRTPPWGKTDQPPFLNAALRIETSLPPRDLLRTVLSVEKELGRERNERWGPRTIDIDILLYGASVIGEAGLEVPHPRLTERAFALAPLMDVLPQAQIAGRPAADWLAETDRARMLRLAEPGWEKD
jgi:2-amino-4-hydroxy-6-hydroxymethyldihydropteridine diphosphokinase